MVLTFADKLQVFRMPVSLLQALLLLMINIMLLTLCLSVQTIEAGGWEKIKTGLGLLAAGGAATVYILAAPVNLYCNVAELGYEGKLRCFLILPMC